MILTSFQIVRFQHQQPAEVSHQGSAPGARAQDLEPPEESQAVDVQALGQPVATGPRA